MYTTEQTKQFLDALTDYLSDGAIGIAAIPNEQAQNLSRSELNALLIGLMKATVEHSE